MFNRYSLSVVLPVYNECDLIGDAIQTIVTFVSTYFEEYEIIVVESGSSDGTGEICDRLGQDNPQIKVIHEGGRYGFGSALLLGFKNAQKDLVWMVTADIPFPPESILQALPYFDSYDCVLSYRSKDDRSFSRKMQSVIFNTLIKTALNLRVRHINSAFKAYKREVIQSLRLHSKGWFVDSEILYRLKQNHVSCVEIPVELIERTSGKSTITLFSPFKILGELYTFLRYYR